MADQDPVGRPIDPTEPRQTGNEASLSDEALEAMFDEPVVEQVEQEEQEEPEQEEVAEEAAEVVEDDQEEVQEEVAAEEPAAEVEEAPEATYDPMEEMQLRLEEAEISQKLMESQIGRSTGNEGYLKKRIKQLEDQLATRASQPQVDEYGDTLEAPSSAPAPAPADPAISYVVTQAARDGGNEFVSEITGGKPVTELPEDDQKAIVEALNSLKTDDRRREQFLQIRNSGDPEYARSATRDLLTTAYLSLRRGQIRERRQQMRESNSASLKKRKQAASVTQSKAPVTRSKRRTPTDVRALSDDELKKALFG